MKHKKIIADYWLEYYMDEKTTLCKLCGNTGIINIEKVYSPTGLLLKPVHTFCFCPNGRATRKYN